VKTAVSGKNTTKTQNQFLEDPGNGIQSFVQAGKNISILFQKKKNLS